MRGEGNIDPVMMMACASVRRRGGAGARAAWNPARNGERDGVRWRAHRARWR